MIKHQPTRKRNNWRVPTPEHHPVSTLKNYIGVSDKSTVWTLRHHVTVCFTFAHHMRTLKSDQSPNVSIWTPGNQKSNYGLSRETFLFGGLCRNHCHCVNKMGWNSQWGCVKGNNLWHVNCQINHRQVVWKRGGCAIPQSNHSEIDHSLKFSFLCTSNFW